MTPTERQVMERAAEALEVMLDHMVWYNDTGPSDEGWKSAGLSAEIEAAKATLATLRTALAQPVQVEPDGWRLVPVEPTPQMIEAGSHCWMMTDDNAESYWNAMLAAAPPPPKREPLTDAELEEIAVSDEFLLYCDQDDFNEIARATEAAHGITPKESAG